MAAFIPSTICSALSFPRYGFNFVFILLYPFQSSLLFSLNEGKVDGMAISRVIAALLLLVPALFGIKPVFAEIGEKPQAKLEQEYRQFEREREHFELFSQCVPVGLQVFVDESITKLGLTKEEIRRMAEARLKAASLYREKDNPFPYVTLAVQTAGRAFLVDLRYWKGVVTLDPRIFNAEPSTWPPEMFGESATWSDLSFGTFKGKDFIQLQISKTIDLFIADYLRVNEADCLN